MARKPKAWLMLIVFVQLGLSPPVLSRLESAATDHWSYRPVTRPHLPVLSKIALTRGGIDRFVLARLEREGLAGSPPATGNTLIRRVFLDLIGLPPSPREVEEYLNDTRPDAYSRLLDRLLASPHYGEKWARPWMDLCHYGDTDGYLTDQLRPYAWRYRQWLIDSLNANLPFDQFTIQQLAGDLLPHATIEQRIATGFLRQTLSNREGGADLEEFRVLQVVDRTSMVGTIWLGLTVECARCHDHKYDPISQREFYQLYAFFDNADEVNIDAPLGDESALLRETLSKYERQRSELIATQHVQLQELQRRWELRMLQAQANPGQDAHWDRQWELLGLVWGGGRGEGQLEGIEIVKLDPQRRSQRQMDDLRDYFLSNSGGIDPQLQAELKLDQLRQQLDELKAPLPQIARAPTMRAAQNPRQSYVHVRGTFRDRGPIVRANVPACLPSFTADAARLDSNSLAARQNRDSPRLALARWLVSPKNPLTARVTVNRMWQEFFGSGIVLTSEDFGTRGEPPSHPRLLDWLAAEFVESGWDVKAMHRLIVTSSTYRQQSRPRADLTERDPDNVLLARQSSLRVPAETVRDLSLAVGGLLSRKIGGPSVMPPQPQRVVMEAFDNKQWRASEGEDRYRRGVYTFTIRTAPFAQSAIFDAPNPSETCTRRDRSNTPLQALTLLNDEVFFEAAQGLAARVLHECRGGLVERIDYAFNLCMSRRPTPSEKKRLTDFYQQYLASLSDDPEKAIAMVHTRNRSKTDAPELAAWSGLCSVLLNLHEFITRD